MVLAAWLRRIPAALTEADAHLGLANRLAAPFVRRIFLAYPIAGRGREGARRRPADPRGARRRCRATRRARALGLPEDGPLVLVFGGSQGARTLNEARRRRVGRTPARRAAPLRRARLRTSCAARVTRADYRPRAVRRRLRRCARRRRHRRRARGRLGLGGRGGRQARDARPVSARDRRPPAAERASTSSSAGGAVVVDDADVAARVPAARRGAARRHRAAAADGGRDARRREARCRRQDRR